MNGWCESGDRSIEFSDSMRSLTARSQRRSSACAIPPLMSDRNCWKACSFLQAALKGRQHACRSWKVVPLEGVGIGSVPTGDALDGTSQVVEASFLDQCRELAAEPAEPRRLMYDHAAAGATDRRDHALDVKRHDAPQVDQLRVDATLLDRRE